MVDVPEAVKCQIAQTSPHRFSHQQGARQNSRPDSDAEGNGQMNAPVVGERTT